MAHARRACGAGGPGRHFSVEATGRRGFLRPMLNIDLTGKRAFVAGVADDGGFGFAIAKQLAEAGASVCVGTWPPAYTIFTKLIQLGKIKASLQLERGGE